MPALLFHFCGGLEARRPKKSILPASSLLLLLPLPLCLLNAVDVHLNMVASTSKQASEDRLQPSNASNSGSDSEDDDFVPEETGEPSGSVANTSTVPKKPSKTTNAGSDIDSDAAESDDDEGKTAAQGDGIDDEELDALKRERAELVAAAGGEDRLGKRRRLAPAANTDAVDSGVVDSEAEALKAKALAEWEAIKGSDSAPTATDLPTSASSQHAPTSSSASPG